MVWKDDVKNPRVLHRALTWPCWTPLGWTETQIACQSSSPDLTNAVVAVWAQTPTVTRHNLVKNLPRRIEERGTKSGIRFSTSTYEYDCSSVRILLAMCWRVLLILLSMDFPIVCFKMKQNNNNKWNSTPAGLKHGNHSWLGMEQAPVPHLIMHYYAECWGFYFICCNYM